MFEADGTVSEDFTSDSHHEHLPAPTPTDTLPPTEPHDDPDGLAETIVQLGCLESAVRLEQVRVITRADQQQLWVADGQTTLANWLALQLGCGRRHARELALVAHKIDSLPALAEAFGQGRLSWDQ